MTNLAKGMHDPIWLKDAWTAHHRRAAGDFDAFYIRKLEVDWNVTIPDEFKPPHLRRKHNGDFPAGHSSSGEGCNLEAPGDIDAVAEKMNGAVECVAVEPPVGNKADTTSTKNPDGTSGSSEAAESSVKDPSNGSDSPRCRVVAGKIALNERLSELETNGGEIPPANGTARGAAEDILGTRQKASGINGSEPMTAGGKAAGLEDSMELDGPEALIHSD